MAKNKKPRMELDDDFFAQLDFLRYDYDNILTTVEQQKKDIQRLMALLVENGIPIPGDLIDRYISRASESSQYSEEELPFD